MKKALIFSLLVTTSFSSFCSTVNVKNSTIEHQRELLALSVDGKGVGPQSPRDIDNLVGENKRIFSIAPPSAKMNLCNIHFHKNAEHKGGEFTSYAGNGDGKGFNTGFRYTGKLSKEELKPFQYQHLESGDTIEVHYVYSSANVKPGATLSACISDSIKNPSLRVESQVFVLVNDNSALNFENLASYGLKNGYYQALNIPTNTGKPIEYLGSTTGPGYNEKASPYQVTWSVRPKVAKVSISSVANWMKNNDFEEDHAHGVRNLIKNPKLLSNGF
ncbi:conserved exported hypothetical protein [Vibrio chagasii]|uniref:delta-class carbonic anhydrase n=1 Tax=Vibrio TaxID=662 RepID=UPI000E32BC5C|nr:MULTISPECIES: delta-class carbonic anhydrase [Vibrio]MCG9561354.1 hypothetical protein [Vibrio chagasii]MCG9673665.1 hypothetical protein [Vibrio chagasii]CAH6938612.1 conserved exported hypothetical protein [Vibrio chagasii]CAH6954538.1 conserved exported hypothetical protein [Vibrio chagasii]CAH6989401.1 conserved exported hypothetical protein [Vibrio chagasii]